MIRSALLAATLLAPSVLPAFAGEAELQNNKQIVEQFTGKAWSEKNADLVNLLVSKDFVQHNPMSGDGPASITGMFQYVSPKIKTVRSIAEGDLVVTQNDSTGWGSDVRYVSFDVFRIKDKQVVEHWDVMQPFAEKTASGHSMIDGETKIADLDKTAANKALVEGFLKDVIYGGNFKNMANYISTKAYTQHNPSVKDGLQGLGEAMAEMQKNGQAMGYEKTFRVIAEGNFVMVHSKGQFAGKSVAFADLMRVEDGKIVEHWDVIQDEVPADKTKSGHDMFMQVSK